MQQFYVLKVAQNLLEWDPLCEKIVALCKCPSKTETLNNKKIGNPTSKVIEFLKNRQIQTGKCWGFNNNSNICSEIITKIYYCNFQRKFVTIEIRFPNIFEKIRMPQESQWLVNWLY